MSTELIDEIQSKQDQQIKEPDMYTVVLFNDDFTTMEFVVETLVQVFHLTVSEATKVMLAIHKQGKGRVGSYTYDIAETKARQVQQIARQRQFPLRTSIEKA